MVYSNPIPLRQSWENTQQALDFLAREDQQFEKQKGVSSWIVSFFSHANQDETRFRKELDRTQSNLASADQAMRRGDLPYAERLLHMAQRRLAWSYRHRGEFLAKTAKGAETALPTVPAGIVGLGASVLVGAVNPPLGIALGVATAGHEAMMMASPLVRDARAGQALIEEAQIGLKAHASAAKPDMAKFFVKSEAFDEGIGNLQDLQEAWEEDMQALKVRVQREANWEKQIEVMMDGLFELGLGEYSRGEAQFTGFQMFGEGNCETETKAISAAFQAMEIQLPPGKVFGQQLMPRHIQAVIYDHNSEKVWDLLNKKKNLPLQAPIFQPELMHFAYLKGKGVEPSISERELLIAEPPNSLKEGMKSLAGKAYIYLTNSKLKFPSVNSGSGDVGPVPERARIENPYRGPEENEGSLASENPAGAPRLDMQGILQGNRDHGDRGAATCVEDLPDPWKGIMTLRLLEVHARVTKDPYRTSQTATPLVFRDRKDLAQYRALSSESDRSHFVQQILKEDAETLLNSQDGMLALSIYQGKKSEKLRELINQSILREFNQVIIRFTHDAAETTQGLRRQSEVTKALAPYFEAQWQFLNVLDQNPREFLALLESMHYATRKILLQTLTELDSPVLPAPIKVEMAHTFPSNQLKGYASLRDYVLTLRMQEGSSSNTASRGTGQDDAARDLNSILEAAQKKAREVDLQRPQDIIEIETGDWDFSITKEVGEAPAVKPPPAKSISPRLLIDLLLNTPWLADAANDLKAIRNRKTTIIDTMTASEEAKLDSILNLWTPALSDRLLTFNAKGHYKGHYDDQIRHFSLGVAGLLLGRLEPHPLNILPEDARIMIRSDWVPLVREIAQRTRVREWDIRPPAPKEPQKIAVPKHGE